MVDLNSMELSKIYECIEFWCKFCELNEENEDTLKKTAKNLDASKNIRISEYLNGGSFSNFEFVDKFGAWKKNLIAESAQVEVSKSFQRKEEAKSAKISRIKHGSKNKLY